MASKSEKLNQLLDAFQPSWKAPEPLDEGTLLEQGLLLVLTRTLTEAQAVATVKALRAAYPDWNELRVSQIQEFRDQVKSKSDATALTAAADVRTYLQEIFQKNHGFDIEFLRAAKVDDAKFVQSLEFLGGAAGHTLMMFAQDGALPVTPGVVRVLDRAGVMGRTTSMKKARERLEPLVPKKRYADFAGRLGEVADRWCDSRKPTCWECPLVELCTYGARVHRDWKVQQKRLAAQRKKEQERLEAVRKKEEAKRKREEERARKRAEAEAKKRAREEARRKIADERKRKKAEAAKKRIAAAAKREAERKKKAGKKKAQPTKKKAAKKKATTKKKSAKKTSKKKTTKKSAKKKPASKTARKKVTKKKTARKSSSRKTTKKRSATKKKATKRRR